MIHPEKSHPHPIEYPGAVHLVQEIRTCSLLHSVFPERLISLFSSILCSSPVLTNGMYNITSRGNDKKTVFKDDPMIVGRFLNTEVLPQTFICPQTFP
jgi:hypothetical protein